jgi:23S rRNA pseudouridine1911/1915/1917 synthase
MQIYEFTAEENGIRLDKYIKIDNMPRSQIQRLIDDGNVTVNGKEAKGSLKLKQGDKIEVTVPPPVDADIKPENIPLDIVYEDEHILVVNKPQGMVVHPAHGNLTGTLVNALMHHCKDSLSGINGVMRPGIVHRIDKDTSGLLLVAKTNEAHLSLSEQIKSKTAHRHYICIVCGIVENKKGIIDAPIGRHPTNRLKMAVTPNNSKNAVTHFEVIEHLNNATYVACDLETGRTHQIRVHMQYIGHPIIGDPLYLNKNPYNLKGQALHAQKISFDHPITKERMEFSVDAPKYFYELLEKLR